MVDITIDREFIIKDLISSDSRLSSVLKNAIVFSKRVKNIELENWLKLELHGYFNSNPILTNDFLDDIEIPKYRTVSGFWYNSYNRPITFTDPEIGFVNEFRLRYGVAELESIPIGEDFLELREPNASALFKKFCKIDVQFFSAPTTQLSNVFEGIRTTLLDKIMALELEEDINTIRIQKNIVCHVNSLIISGELDRALEILGKIDAVKDEVVQLRSQLSEIEKKERLNIAPSNEIAIEKNKLRASILNLKDYLLKKKT